MSEKKMHRYLITMRWYIETDEELVPGAKKTDDKLLDILRHKKRGVSSCDGCPTRHSEGHAILEYHDFMGDKPVFMTTEKITE